jgi:dolichol kinase
MHLPPPPPRARAAARLELLLLLLPAVASLPSLAHADGAVAACALAALLAAAVAASSRASAPAAAGLRAADDPVGAAAAALLPLGLLCTARRTEVLRVAWTAAGLTLGLPPGFNAAAAATACFFGGEADLVAMAGAVAMPLGVPAAAALAPGVFTLAEACLVVAAAVHGVCVPVLRDGGEGGFAMDALPTACALFAAAALALLVLPLALCTTGKRRGGIVAAGYAGAVCLVYAQARRMLHGREPMAFVVDFSCGSAARRGLLGYWVAVLAVSLAWAVPAATRRCQRIVARKTYHLLALVLFLPGVAVDPAFMSFAMAVALVLMLTAEVVRVAGHGRVAGFIDASVKEMCDERDEGPLIVTHIYLLIGNALPLWVAVFSGFGRRGVLAVSGIVCLDVLDAVASVVGSRYGKTRWFSLQKTAEGTAAGVAAAVGSSVAWSFAIGVDFDSFYLAKLLVATVGAGLYEASTSQIDNLVLPAAYYAFLVACDVN